MSEALSLERGSFARAPHRSFQIEPHADHKRLRAITLPAHVVETFLERVSDVDVQALEYVPYKRFCIANELARAAGPDFQQTLLEIIRDRSTGGFTIGLNDQTSNEEDYVKFGTAIAHLIGPSNHDSMSNKYYARFIVKHTDESDSYLRQAYRLFTLHTDGTFVDEATDWLLMMKFSEENAIGGESRILHLDDWEDLHEFAGAPMSRTPFEYKAPGSKNVSYAVHRPLFFENEFGLCASFIDQFVQPKTIDEATFLNAFSQSLETSAGTVQLPLPKGDLIVLNNYFWFHGRAAFERHEGLHRELMRQRGVFSAPTQPSAAH